MLKPRLATLDPWKARGFKTVEDLKKPWLKLEDIKTARWVKTKKGRLLPLNNAAWRKLRASVLQEQPMCADCEARGLLVPASEVHHINDDACDNTRSNLVGLCKQCHSRHTAHDQGFNVPMGCDVTGKPLNPHHHWNNATETNLVRPVVSPVCQPLLKSPVTEAL